MGEAFRQVLEAARASVLPELERTDAIMKEIAENAPGKLSECLKVLVERKGKRIRATFLFLLAKVGETKPDIDRAAKVAAAIELLHLASLVHDDIIDGSDLRRNQKTAHKLWGNRMAVLVGDYALSKSMEMVWEDKDQKIPLSISRASSRLVAGEILEVQHIGNLDITLQQYMQVVEGKTAALMQGCGECGAILAGLDQVQIQSCGEMGRDFGIAFQVIDDLLDFGVGAENLGKKTHSDVKNGFVTLPVIQYFESCNQDERQKMVELLQSPQDEKTLQEVNMLLWKSGAFEKAREAAESRILNCHRVLGSLPETESQNHMRKMCELMPVRSA